MICMYIYIHIHIYIYIYTHILRYIEIGDKVREDKTRQAKTDRQTDR